QTCFPTQNLILFQPDLYLKKGTIAKMKKFIIKFISIILIFILVSSLSLILLKNRTYAANISEDINGLDDSKYPGIKSMIQSLQSQYPNWNFKIFYTGLNWNEVISGEYMGHNASPKNLVP